MSTHRQKKSPAYLLYTILKVRNWQPTQVQVRVRKEAATRGKEGEKTRAPPPHKKKKSMRGALALLRQELTSTKFVWCDPRTETIACTSSISFCFSSSSKGMYLANLVVVLGCRRQQTNNKNNKNNKNKRVRARNKETQPNTSSMWCSAHAGSARTILPAGFFRLCFESAGSESANANRNNQVPRETVNEPPQVEEGALSRKEIKRQQAMKLKTMKAATTHHCCCLPVCLSACLCSLAFLFITHSHSLTHSLLSLALAW